MSTHSSYENMIAIVGMSCRFPDAEDTAQYWRNIAEGKCSIRQLSVEELMARGVSAELAANPAYVGAVSSVDDIASFDAEFFGISSTEASYMDPQRRLMLMCAYEALEQAGYAKAELNDIVGIFSGISNSTYPFRSVLSRFASFADSEAYGDAIDLPTILANGKEYISTYLSYRLNLTGPSVNVNTACSTSMVAIHQACRALTSYDCDMALAGGSAIVPHRRGYLYTEGGILSSDGRCYAFDARANGTIFGDGVGMVLLKRMTDAMEAGDHIHAVIRGTAINNDGSTKMSFAAPSVTGQMDVIAEALISSSTPADSIGYVETHGTGTALGDPIEFEALNQVYKTYTGRKQFCAIGSVKPNIGHPDSASGVAGLIKTVEALKHRQLPPSIHYEQANPQIDFANSPFYVNTQLKDWPAERGPRRAGVSSFGLGGTNVHVVVEEAPVIASTPPARTLQLLPLSARSPAALQAASERLATHLEQHPALSLADVAYMLQVGRTEHPYRRATVCNTAAEAIAALATPGEAIEAVTTQDASLVWMFPGQGTQHVGMAQELYASEPTFRAHLDICAEGLRDALGLDLRELLYPSESARAAAEAQLRETRLAQPALFAIEYSLARLLQSYGLQAGAMIGHSLGEYVAACLAGVFSLQDGLKLVATRGRLMQGMAAGRMLSIIGSEAQVNAWLVEGVSLAAVNGANQCVVAGPFEAIAALEERLTAQGIESIALETSHAFHSAMMEPMLASWREVMDGVALHAPTLPYVSNLSGRFIRAEEAMDAAYWVRHLRETVRFEAGLESLLSQDATLKGKKLLLEVGPGRVLSRLVKHHARAQGEVVVSLLGRAAGDANDARALHKALGQLWSAGAQIDWSAYHAGQVRQRVPLPTYPFERKRYWVDLDPDVTNVPKPASNADRLAWHDWFYMPSWRLTPPPGTPLSAFAASSSGCMVFADDSDFSTSLVAALSARETHVFRVKRGEDYAYNSHGAVIDAAQPAHYRQLFDDLKRAGRAPDTIVHAFNLSDLADSAWTHEPEALELSLYSLLYLVQAVNECMPLKAMRLHLLGSHLAKIADDDRVQPERALLTGAGRAIPRECPHIVCKAIDVAGADRSSSGMASRVALEILGGGNDEFVAYRGARRWVQAYEPVRFDAPSGTAPLLRKNGVYLIAGGLGGMGLAIARYLAESIQARLVLISRSGLPPRETWQQLLTADADTLVCKQIEQVLQLEGLGSEVIVRSADIADVDQVHRIATEAKNHFGAVHGVIHAAGVVGDSMITTKSRENVAAVIQPKIAGTAAIDKALASFELDIFILCSSMAAVMGGIGQFDYSAANAFQDAFAVRHDGTSATRYMSINWDVWKEVGMATRMQLPAHLKTQTDQRLESAISTQEGVNAFAALMARPLPHWMVTTRAPDVLKAMTDGVIQQEQPIAQVSGQKQAKPPLATAYVPPQNDIEKTLAAMWEELLSIEQIGVHDNFFELGGDSIRVTRLHAMMRNRLPVLMQDMSLKLLFEHPTIGAIAELLKSHDEARQYAGQIEQLRQGALVTEEGEI